MNKEKTWIFICTVILATLTFTTSEYNNLYKVSMTQKGYIQFLKYDVNFPPLQEFTFCLWMKSVNLTHPHPLFSYSKHEHTSIVRSWISPSAYIHLSIMNHKVSKVPLGRWYHNTWYHICHSWNGRTGQWALHLGGELAASGVNHRLKGVLLPGKGDVVVGQEYTDFDKGLDDGIEGEVFGFNMVKGGSSHIPYYWALPDPQMELILRGFSHCTEEEGTPITNTKQILVSWARTPVRVFGGAMVAEANPVCGHF